MTKKTNHIKSVAVTAIITFLITISIRLSAQTLTLAVAANFRDPMTEISTLFEKENPDIEVRAIFGSSGSLYQQISQHAPYDIFFSANMSYAQKAFEEGYAYEKAQIYSIGQLVLWSSKIDVGSGINILQDENVKKISVANPTLAPYGASSIECLKYYNLYEDVKNKLVIADNISQTAQFAATGNVEIGMLAMSQLHSKSIENKGNYYIIPPESYPPIKQGFVIIKKENNESIARKFISFMNTDQVNEIILRYGYRVEE